ncbi:Coenzyme F420 hydrogenase/dehydrogenase, beta subunit C-terminal domain [Leisingera sp. ANG-M1]|uniref:Coenzyme F420 hydrogenase/dehydrogenase, beta subunit C-terminal domain n=1 Tax=Leisingera sp. ANG-M1 TaxID=1577895 RepID=UPI00068AA71A|nr:Coenzyme F420 hydrogenase/dehydrogenase, beta subunit C-terminal domain [Leisingera sp. ANG-M1]
MDARAIEFATPPGACESLPWRVYSAPEVITAEQEGIASEELLIVRGDSHMQCSLSLPEVRHASSTGRAVSETAADVLERLDPEQVTGFRYRGCPGPTRIEMADGTVVEKRYTDFWGTNESMWVLPLCCKVCPDGIGETADTAAPHIWSGCSPAPETDDDDPGTNAIVVRSARDADLVRRAVEAGYLTVTEEVDPRDMDSVQPQQRNKKYAVGTRYEGLRAADAACQREGTRERVQIDRASESTPKLRD